MSAPEEFFDIFSEKGEPIGQAARSTVHAKGLWHKSSQVFLFDDARQLYLQLRVAEKDVCGGLWDMSVAEHLRPGETYLEGATRGLAEELGIKGITLQALGEPQRIRLDQPELGIHDHEMQQVFSGTYQGALDLDLNPDPAEVDDVRAVTLRALAEWIRSKPDEFTPWLLRDLDRYSILERDQEA
jgi:isopentenyl-diphosphate delta-isomerase